MTEVFNEGNDTIIKMADVGYYYSVKGESLDDKDFDFFRGAADTNNNYLTVGEYKIVPAGPQNNLHDIVRGILDNNHLGEGAISREIGLQWGQGIGLYRNVRTKDGITREWADDKTIDEWLKSWDLNEYVLRILSDIKHYSESFTKVYRNKGPRVGNAAKIAKLEHIEDTLCRREWPDANMKFGHILVKDWKEYSDPALVYPLCDLYATNLPAVSIAWSYIYQSGRTLKQPILPAYMGALRWMKRSNAVPEILKNLTENSLNIKWHIISPKKYWDDKREILKQQCEEQKIQYKEQMLEDLKTAILKSLSTVLSGIDNVGKFFHSESVLETLDIGKSELMKWEIIPIDQKVSDFIDSQIKISERADSATTSGIGLHPSMSNIIINGKLASGSEMLYAYKLYLASNTVLIENKVFEVINKALFYNFNTDLKMGFYHSLIQREDALSSSDRVTSNDN